MCNMYIYQLIAILCIFSAVAIKYNVLQWSSIICGPITCVSGKEHRHLRLCHTQFGSGVMKWTRRQCTC